jgi:hypothetical protein
MSTENKKCESSSLDNSTETRKVYINIGGRIHVTSSATLAKSRYFSALLKDEKYGINEKDTPFIDRNGDTFSSVLDCLRNNGELFEVPTRKLLHELDYFMIDIYNPGNFQAFAERNKKEIQNLEPKTQEVIGGIFERAIDLIVKTEEVYLSVWCYIDNKHIEIVVGNVSSSLSCHEFDWENREIISSLLEKFQRECFFRTLFYFGWKIVSTIEERKFGWDCPFIMTRKD